MPGRKNRLWKLFVLWYGLHLSSIVGHMIFKLIILSHALMYVVIIVV
jgi:hypothetical protein